MILIRIDPYPGVLRYIIPNVHYAVQHVLLRWIRFHVGPVHNTGMVDLNYDPDTFVIRNEVLEASNDMD